MKKLVLAALLFACTSPAHADATLTLTIGSPAHVTGAFACRNKEAAVTLATMIRDQGVSQALTSPTAVTYVQRRICGIIGGMYLVPLSVPYNVALDTERVLKVVTVATQWPPNPETNLFMIGTNTIIGSGIKEVSAEGSI